MDGTIIRRAARHLAGNAVAYLALFVALGGTAMAAGPVIRGRDVVDGSLTGKDVRNRSLTGKDVRDGSLKGADVAAGTFLGAGDQAVDAAKLEGHPASDFLAPGGTVANATNATKLDGHAATDFLRAGGTAVNATKLDGHAASDFLAATGRATDSAKLGGFAAGDFLAATDKAADSAKLDGHAAGDFLAATGKAADSAKLDGNAASEFARHPLTASVGINGSANVANGLTSSKRYTGVYFVQATGGQDLTACAVSVHLGVTYASLNVDYYKDSTSWAPNGEVATYAAFVNNDFGQTGMAVVTRDSAGTAADKPFVFSAVC